MRNSLWSLCLAYPDILFIGVEVYEPGLIKLACSMHREPIHNLINIPEYAADWQKHAPDHWIPLQEDIWITRRKHTKYEARGERLGHTITDIVYQITNPL